jgi:uncharacterized membrane protein
VIEERWTSRLVMAGIYLVAGILHFPFAGPLLGITPSWVPYPHFVILATGVCEIIGAVALLTSRFRWRAGVALALYAVCVYPANIKHAIDGLSAVDASGLGWLYHVTRLAFQPVFVWWALYAGGVVDWPFASRKS